jgi:hypothetical protein
VRTPPRAAARAAGRVAAVLAAALALAGCISVGDVTTDEHLSFEDDRSSVQVVSTLLGGKNVFVPSTLVLTSGTGRTLSFFNTTDQPHGLRIPGLGIETVLMPGQEQVVALPKLEAGHIWEVQCHLHPPHRTASLVVLPAD